MGCFLLKHYSLNSSESSHYPMMSSASSVFAPRQQVMNNSSTITNQHDDVLMQYHDPPLDWSFVEDYFHLDHCVPMEPHQVNYSSNNSSSSYGFEGSSNTIGVDGWDYDQMMMINNGGLVATTTPTLLPPFPASYENYDVSRTMIMNRNNDNDETRKVDCNTNTNTSTSTRAGRKRWGHHTNPNNQRTLEMEDIQKYFDMPITRAAKEMKVGLTVLKRRCRELNIMRWPHRKMKSLNSLINSVKEMGMMEEEILMLEQHRKLLETTPDMELTERTKKLRQACFKANYKKRVLSCDLSS